MFKIRIALIATTSALSLAGALPAASQAKAHTAVGVHGKHVRHTSRPLVLDGAGGSASASTRSPTSLARTVKPGPGRVTPIVTTTTISEKPVEAGSTGDGPADDRECQGYAATINFVLEEAQEELNTNGNGSDFDMLVDYAKNQQDTAEEVGCYIVNPM